MAAPPLHIDVEDVGGVRELTLAGELDLGNATDAARRLVEVAHEAARVLVDLDAVEYLDSTGLRTLDRLHAAAVAAGTAVAFVAGPDRPARRILALTGLDLALPVAPTREDGRSLLVGGA